MFRLKGLLGLKAPAEVSTLQISAPFNPQIESGTSSSHLSKYFQDAKALEDAQSRALLVEAPAIPAIVENVSALPAIEAAPLVPLIDLKLNVVRYTPRVINLLVDTAVRGHRAHKLTLAATKPMLLWARIKARLGAKGHLGFKKPPVLIYVLENLGLQFRLLQSFLVEGDGPSGPGDTTQLDVLWEKLIEPITAICQVIALALLSFNRNVAIFKIDAANFARALTFIATGLNQAALMLDYRLGKVMTMWTQRSVRFLTDAAESWLAASQAMAEVAAPVVPEMQERSSSSSEVLVRRRNANHILDHNTVMTRYPTPEPVVAGPSTAAPSQRASTAASGIEQSLETSVEAFPKFESLPRTPPPRQGWK